MTLPATEDSDGDSEQKLPQKPREGRVPSREEVPSTGFFTPHQRDRFEVIKQLTDEHTAIKLYAMVNEGGYANFETALKAAINKIDPKRETVPDGTRWRYYCRECGFIGPAMKTYSRAEHSSGIHDDASDGCDSVVFSYFIEDWGPENVEELVDRYQEAATDADGGDS